MSINRGMISSSIDRTLSKKGRKEKEKEPRDDERRERERERGRRKGRGKERDGWLQLSLMAEESMFVTLRLCKLDAAFT